MIQTVYKLKNPAGLYFNNARNGKRFSKEGQGFKSLALLELSLSACFKTEPQSKILKECKVVEEQFIPRETEVPFDLVELSDRLNRKAVAAKKLDKRRIPFMVRQDIFTMFPTWELNGFTHVLTVDYSKTKFLRGIISEELKDCCKQAGLKRSQYRVGNHSIALKEKSVASVVKLSSQIHFLHFSLEGI